MSEQKPSSASDTHKSRSSSISRPMHWGLRWFLIAMGVLAAGLVSVLIVAALAMAVAFPNLPDISDLSDYRPKLPLRIFSTEGVLIGEFGEERRHLTPIKEIPKVMTNAVLAVEDGG